MYVEIETNDAQQILHHLQNRKFSVDDNIKALEAAEPNEILTPEGKRMMIEVYKENRSDLEEKIEKLTKAIEKSWA